MAITTEVITRDFFNRPFTQEGAGSGWIIDEDGHIATNNHVIAGAKSITLQVRSSSDDPTGCLGDFADAIFLCR